MLYPAELMVQMLLAIVLYHTFCLIASRSVQKNSRRQTFRPYFSAKEKSFVGQGLASADFIRSMRLLVGRRPRHPTTNEFKQNK